MNLLTCIRAAFLALLCVISPLALAAEAPQTATEQSVMLDINEADAATIAASLEGIGPATAKEIVTYWCWPRV